MEMKNDHDGYLMLINRDRAGQKVVIFDMMMMYVYGCGYDLVVLVAPPMSVRKPFDVRAEILL